MVVALGPGKFYGSALPRPRFYSDVKLSPDGLRVDPPLPVLDPLLSWAHDAHWSMGGLSFLRRRLQGRIEGSVKRLRAQHERRRRFLNNEKKKMEALRNHGEEEELGIADSGSSSDEEDAATPIPVKPADRPRRSGRTRKRVVSEDEEEDVLPAPVEEQQQKKKRARKLGDEFDRVADGSASPLPVAVAALKEVRKGAVVAVPRRSGRLSPQKN